MHGVVVAFLRVPFFLGGGAEKTHFSGFQPGVRHGMTPINNPTHGFL